MKEEIKVAFWNIAGLLGRDEEFWKELERWDMVVMLETWVEEKCWERVRNRLPKGYMWRMQAAKRMKRKGRAKGGIIMGIRKDLIEEVEEEIGEKDGIVIGRIRWGRKAWRVIGVYVNGDLKEKLEKMRGWFEERERDVEMIIGGVFTREHERREQVR